ncbi:AfsR/SARP family transcriptional regulator [Lentzea atacamensis]|uniref:AfsR/SARP family transcriptional regulator n=1 Tax=Lentzea atacamensis TaxID=531938 RepID=UPI001F3410AD|nr:AfsR/SARP family transcriptional regulator [Lentzea atacamensis]
MDDQADRREESSTNGRLSSGCDPVVAQVGVLGQIEAAGPLGPVALVGARQRTVLGALALRVGTVLPFTRLVDVLWGDDPPRTGIKTLHSHVARIRRALAGAGLSDVLLTREPGYLLTGVDVDARRFEELVRAGRGERSPQRAAALLRDALALWRGDAFADAPPTGWALREVERLDELRSAALEDLWDAELRDGNHEQALVELPALLAVNPTSERLTRLHMLALYRSGRHTDALDAFQRLRRLLAEELGVDPGPELVELNTAILRRDVSLDQPVTRVPAELPARVGHFTGRGDVLAGLDRILDGDLPVVVISGPAGMGKTSLAVEWGHRIADRFPGGRLFLDLRGHDDEQALSGAQALAHVLRVLGLPEDHIPVDEGERAALYRTLVHDRRCVIVLDNAGDVRDVVPLVPGGGASLLVVTTRRSPAALAARHAVHPVLLDALAHDESLSLLRAVAGEQRVAAEPEAADRLVELCGGMPLALRIAAARLLGSPHQRIAALVAELTEARLDGLAVEGDSRTVRAVIDSAYRPLAEEPAQVFRRAALAPGPTFSSWLISALAETESVAVSLASLATAHLVTEVESQRFRFHDLIREYARSRLTDDERAEAAARVLDWYMQAAHEVNLVANPARDLVRPLIRYPWSKPPFPPERHAALTFLDGERENLLPVVQFARDQRDFTATWQLTYLLTSFYEATGHWHERVEMCQVAVGAAAELGDRAAEAEMLRALGVALFMTRRLAEAIEANHAALAIVREIGDLASEGHVHNNLANALAELRRFDEAVRSHQRATECCARAGNSLGRALSQRNLGHTYIRMGAPEASLEPLGEALEAFRELGNTRLEAGTLNVLGEAHLRRGEPDLALRELERALDLSREIGDRWLEWAVLADMGRAHLDRDGHGVVFFDQALAISREMDDRHGVAVVLGLLGRAHLRVGDLDAAAGALTAALAERSRMPDAFEEAHVHRDLGELADRRGDRAAARRHRDRASSLYLQVGATAEASAIDRT